MRYSVVPQVYTITAFGASILMWPSLSRVAIMRSMEGTPYYLIHPLFTLEFILLLSTAIVWLTAFLFSLHNMHKQKMTFTEAVKQNLLVVSLVLATVIVALSGCVAYSENVHFEESRADDLLVLPGLRPPNLFTFFRAIHGLGIIICEPAWIITILSKYLPIPSKTLKHGISGAKYIKNVENSFFSKSCPHTRTHKTNFRTNSTVEQKMSEREEELEKKGWTKQNTIGEPRLNELVELYKSIGYEVHLEPVNLNEMSEECRRCYEEDETIRTIYIRKK